MLEGTSGTASFFHAMAPVLTANVLTVAFVYAFAMVTQKERSGVEEGRGTFLWLIVLVSFFMLYGLYTWGVYPFKNEPSSALRDPAGATGWIAPQPSGPVNRQPS